MTYGHRHSEISMTLWRIIFCLFVYLFIYLFFSSLTGEDVSMFISIVN